MEIKEISDDLRDFENLIKAINFEYSQYFSGNIKHPPIVHERKVNKIIKKYNLHQITNSSLRFKFNNLVARYLTFKEKWRRKMLEFEGVKKPVYEINHFKDESENIKDITYYDELDKLPSSYNRDKILSLIESKKIEFENKGYKNIDVKIDMSTGKPKLKIRPTK
jgi:hypothetical protein